MSPNELLPPSAVPRKPRCSSVRDLRAASAPGIRGYRAPACLRTFLPRARAPLHCQGQSFRLGGGVLTKWLLFCLFFSQLDAVCQDLREDGAEASSEGALENRPEHHREADRLASADGPDCEPSRPVSPRFTLCQGHHSHLPSSVTPTIPFL